ncbi:MAG: Methyltransferase type 11 [Myxococcales bacterium]|nr:Methyltransferase type 11 [Myxococcales bacterium]
MARGTTRSPSQNAYRGSIGKTQTTTLHVTGGGGEMVSAQVYTTVDAVNDPELVERLHSDDPARALNVVRTDGGDVIKVAVPVVYHDPAAELLVLVLADAHRHRELDERIKLLERMRDDDAPIPPYAKEFAVVYGPAGLRSYLERRAQDALETARTQDATRDLDKRTKDLDRRASELETAQKELEAAQKELSVAHGELERNRVELEKLRSEARNRVIAAVQAVTDIEVEEPTSIARPPSANDDETRPVAKDELDEIEESLAALIEAPPIVAPPTLAAAPRKRSNSENFEAVATAVVDLPKHKTNGVHHAVPMEIELDDETTGAASMPQGSSIVPQGSDPLTTTTTSQTDDGAPDSWLDQASARETSSVVAVPNGPVRIVLVAGEQLARGLGGNLDIRVLLHRTQTYPVVTLVIGPPPALRVTSTTQLAVIPLDIALDAHRAVLTSLSKSFELTVDLVVRGRRIRRAKLTAPLAENVGYIVRAADDHLRGLTSSGDALPSFERGRDLVLGAGFDLLGSEHPDANEFRDDKLAQLETAQHLRRAIAMARRFARPSREDYLVCTRGFPLPRWRELRRHVLESAVAWGLWMGPELAQVAVSEGLARSRRDLVIRLDRGFETLKRHPTAFDIDGEAADDNYKALSEEARALGVELTRADPNPAGRNGVTVTSEEVSQVSGSIGQTPATGVPKSKSVEELIAELDDRQKRVAAAIELSDRADPRAAAPVIAAVSKMSRAEAVRVLGMSVKFGDAAAAPLTEGLASSKGFLRHGCALALAMLRTEDGTQSVIELLLSEPTEIWREVARAIGQVGPIGLMPLASNYGRLGERATPQAAERVAWAMAHIAVRGGKVAVETMAGGHSVVAPVAKQALELHAAAANDQVRVRPGVNGSQVGKDVTVNRAFSRRFFEALEQGLPDAGAAELEALDASSPMELLDESDLVDDDEAELDESDLIST